MIKVFIDGSAGTTGLRIHDRLSSREDIKLILLEDAVRKDPGARREAIHEADVAFLCLPDASAVESAALAEGSDTAIIDTSTAHRTSDDWTYGFPELSGLRAAIRDSKRIANPGCHASGFISLVVPLVENGMIAKDAELTSFSLTGYSGGGKKMIAEYEDAGRPALFDSPRQYGITQAHKHLPEMKKICCLEKLPVFCPIVADYYAGMEVTVPLFRSQIRGTAEDIRQLYREYYREGLVRFTEDAGEGGLLAGNAYEGRDDMEVSVYGNEDRILLVSRFDNLGKGASGAAIQNMNILLGLPEDTGLCVL